MPLLFPVLLLKLQKKLSVPTCSVLSPPLPAVAPAIYSRRLLHAEVYSVASLRRLLHAEVYSVASLRHHLQAVCLAVILRHHLQAVLTTTMILGVPVLVALAVLITAILGVPVLVALAVPVVLLPAGSF